jgi:Zn-finger nucleic acid-binding protein
MIDIPPAHWFTGGASADSCPQLLHLCLDRGKVEELLDAVAVEHPQAFS